MAEKKTDLRVIKTKRAIRSAFAELLTRKEMQEITIKDVAEAADINRKTFYSHYAGIYQLVDEIENEIVSELREVLCDVDLKRSLKDPYEIFRRLTALINNDIDFYAHLMLMNRNASLVSKIVREMKLSLKETFADQVRMDEFSMDVISDYVIAGMLTVFQNWFNSDRSQSIEKLSGIISVVTTFGLNGFVELA